MRCAIALRFHRRIPRSVGPRAVTCLQPGNFFAAIGVATTAVVSSFIIACECFAKKKKTFDPDGQDAESVYI